MEQCYGCGRQSAERYAMVAIVRHPKTRELVAQPVCDICHYDPGHRTRVIKGHFFRRQDAPKAIALAGADTIRA